MSAEKKEFGYGCFIENVFVANGNDDGSEAEAAEYVMDKLNVAEKDGSARIVTCGRCATSFTIGEGGAMPGSLYVWRTGETKCDRAGSSMRPGWQTNINLPRIEDLAGSAESDL